MSEVFDPENIERVWVTTGGDIIPTQDALFPPAQIFVSAADYDKLLALYREAVDALYAADSELNGEPST